METREFAEEIILYLENQINDEYEKRHTYRNIIYSTALAGMEDNIDAYGSIADSIREYLTSLKIRDVYDDVISYIYSKLNEED